MNITKQIDRISSMEAALDASRAAVGQLSEATVALVDAMDAIQALSEYYGSQEWYQDRKADEQGRLPEGLARGVLSEDLPYDVLVDAREAALGAIEAATATLRVL